MSAPLTTDEIRNPQPQFPIPASITLLDQACCLILRHIIDHLTHTPSDDEPRRHIQANVNLVKGMATPVAVSLRAARMLASPRTPSTPAPDNDEASHSETALDRLTGAADESAPRKPTGVMGEISQEALDRLHRKYPHVPREHKALLRAAAMDIYGPDFMTDIDVAKAYGRPPPPAPEERHRPADNPRATRADPACSPRAGE